MTEIIKIGTRGSFLAMRQAEIVAEEMKRFFPKIECQLVPITTKGDKILDKTLDKIGGKGLFVKEIENALFKNEIDIAVHSMKDMPADMPEGLLLGAVMKREDPRDSLITKDGRTFDSLPKGAKVGTGSLRRKVQLLKMRKDLEIVAIRGNIHTRIKKMEEELDGIVLAAAGLKRCHMENRISSIFQIEEIIPAACQGILALQIRKDDNRMMQYCLPLNHKESQLCARAERAFLNTVGADCHAPVGVYAMLKQDIIHLKAMVYEEEIKIAEIKGSAEFPEALGQYLGTSILK